MPDVVIAGGGPAGLATAIALAQAALSVVVLERRRLPADKACGEGILPAGLVALERMGVRSLLDPEACTPLLGIRYVQEDGSGAEARLPPPGGLGVRRTALSDALLRRARALGVELRDGCAFASHRVTPGGVMVEHTGGRLEAALLIAADGLHSRIRRTAGLDRPPRSRRRFGVRVHFSRAPWSPLVEVHFARGLEAYVTPVGPRSVGVALLGGGTPADENGQRGFDRALARFPALVARLSGARAVSAVRGAGPLARASRARTADRLLLVGDAAGYVDAIAGDGLSVAFACAEALGGIVPGALAHGAGRSALAPYERAFARAFRRYALVSRGLVELAAYPAARTRVIHLFDRHPRLFERAVDWASGSVRST